MTYKEAAKLSFEGMKEVSIELAKPSIYNHEPSVLDAFEMTYEDMRAPKPRESHWPTGRLTFFGIGI